MNRLINLFLNPPVNGPAAILILRLMTGAVFLWEGLIKFVYVNQGIGRFTKLGIPFPEFSANFVGVLEIVGGTCLILGLFTRVFSALFIIEMAVAMLSTKIGIYMGTSPLPLPPSPPQIGFWAVLHEIRSEYAQMLTCIFYSIVGPGVRSLDAVRQRNRTQVVQSYKATSTPPPRPQQQKIQKSPPPRRPPESEL